MHVGIGRPPTSIRLPRRPHRHRRDMTGGDPEVTKHAASCGASLQTEMEILAELPFPLEPGWFDTFEDAPADQHDPAAGPFHRLEPALIGEGCPLQKEAHRLFT